MPGLKDSTGFRYMRDTCFSRQNIARRPEPHISPAETYKQYPAAEKISLAVPADRGTNSLQSLLQGRRSVRRYSRAPAGIEDLAFLLWAAQGVTARAGSHLLRTAPSAGALYPIETYLAVENITGLAPGLFHFDVRNFGLERLTSGPPGQLVARAALNQGFIGKGAAVFIWSAVYRRNMSKYGERGLRYILMDAGHICQNLLLAAAALNLAACPVAAFYDEELNEILDLNEEEESVVYLAVVGGRQP